VNHLVSVSVRRFGHPHLKVAYVHRDDRVVVDDLGYRDDGIMHVSIRYGFQDEHHVPDALRQAVEQGLESEIDIDNASYFVSRITIVRGDAPGMSTWRKKLFLAMANTSTNPVDIFCLPEHRIVTIGSYVEF
jgi:KUP system potassium uptake protein